MFTLSENFLHINCINEQNNSSIASRAHVKKLVFFKIKSDQEYSQRRWLPRGTKKKDFRQINLLERALSQNSYLCLTKYILTNIWFMNTSEIYSPLYSPNCPIPVAIRCLYLWHLLVPCHCAIGPINNQIVPR